MSPTVLESFRELKDVFQSIDTDWQQADFRNDLIDFTGDLEDLHRLYFTQERDPTGEPWLPLARRTIEKKGHDEILFETGRLQESLLGSTQDSVRRLSRTLLRHDLAFGTIRPDAWKHQDGFGIIPQREHVGMTDETLDPFVDVIADSIVRQMKEKRS